MTKCTIYYFCPDHVHGCVIFHAAHGREVLLRLLHCQNHVHVGITVDGRTVEKGGSSSTTSTSKVPKFSNPQSVGDAGQQN